MKMKKEKKENPKLKKVKNIILLLLILYIAINRIYSFFITNETSNNIVNSVTEEYEFIRISECMSKYIDAINSENPNDIIDVYSADYKKENNIKAENVLNINNLSNILFFNIDKLYTDNTKYYVYGTFYSKSANLDIEKNSYEFTINLYPNNTFAITPQIQENLIKGE